MPRVPEYNQRQIALAPVNTPYQTMKPTAEMFGSDVGRALTDTGKAIGPVAETLLKLAATDDDPTDQGTGTAGTPAPDPQQTQTGQTQTAPADAADLMGKGSTPLQMHASVLQAHAEKMQRQDQMASAVQHLADFNQFKRATLFDPDTGFYGKSGWDAADSFAATKQSLESYAGRVVNGIRNPQTASLVRRALDTQIGGALDGMARHAAAGRRQGLDATDRLGMEDAIADGTMNYLDPAQLGAAYRRGLMHNQATITRNNLDAHSAEQAVQDYNTQFFTPVIRQFVTKGDIAGARRVLARQAGNITPAAHAQLDHYLTESGLNQQAQLLTDGILRSRLDQADNAGAAQAFMQPSPPDLAARLAKVDEIEDPDLRQRVGANVTLATQQEKQAYLANQRQLKSQAKDILDRGSGITSIPYQIYTGIDPKGRDALNGYAKAGGQITTDPVTFQRLRDQALDRPQDFLDTDLNDYIHLVDGKDMSKLSTLQHTLKDKGADDPAFSLQRVKGQSADVMLGMLGLPIRLTGTAGADSAGPYSQAASFKQYIDQYASAEEASIGRDLTPDEHQQLLVKKTVEAGVVHLASETLPASGKGEAAANDNAVSAKDDIAEDAQRADSPSGDDENTDSDDGEYDADVTIGEIGTDPNENNVSLNGDIDAAKNGVQPNEPAQPKAGADSKTGLKQAPSANKPAIAVAGSTAAVAIGDAGAGWTAAAGSLVRGFAARTAAGGVALGATALTPIALAIGTFLVGVLLPTSTAGPELDEFHEPLLSGTSRRRKKNEIKKAAKAKGEPVPKKEKRTGATGLPPEDQRDPKDRRGDKPFKKPNEPLEPGDWIDLDKFSERGTNSDRTNLEDPESKYYIERDGNGHAEKWWKLKKQNMPQGQDRIKSISRYGKVLSD